MDDYYGIWVHFEDREHSRYAKHFLWSEVEWFEMRGFPRDEVENPEPPPGYCQLQDVKVGEAFLISGACGKEIEGIVLKKGYVLPDSVARSDDRTQSYVLLPHTGKVETFPISTLVRKRPYPT